MERSIILYTSLAVILAISVILISSNIYSGIIRPANKVQLKSYGLESGKGVTPVPKYRIYIDTKSATGFINIKKTSEGLKFVIRQGDTGSVKIVLKRLYNEKTLWILLRLYGIGPNYNKNITGIYKNQSLPNGLTYALNPSLVRISSDKEYIVTLIISTDPDIKTGVYKLNIEATSIYYDSRAHIESTSISIILEIIPK